MGYEGETIRLFLPLVRKARSASIGANTGLLPCSRPDESAVPGVGLRAGAGHIDMLLGNIRLNQLDEPEARAAGDGGLCRRDDLLHHRTNGGIPTDCSSMPSFASRPSRFGCRQRRSMLVSQLGSRSWTW